MCTRSPRKPFLFNFMFIDEIQSNNAIADHEGNDHCTFWVMWPWFDSSTPHQARQTPTSDAEMHCSFARLKSCKVQTMQISPLQTDDRANYLICSSGNLRIILLCEDVAPLQFHLCALAWFQKDQSHSWWIVNDKNVIVSFSKNTNMLKYVSATLLAPWLCVLSIWRKLHWHTRRLITSAHVMCTYKGPLILDLSKFQRHNVLPKANNVK